LRRTLQLRSVPDHTALYRFLRRLDEAAITRPSTKSRVASRRPILVAAPKSRSMALLFSAELAALYYSRKALQPNVSEDMGNAAQAGYHNWTVVVFCARFLGIIMHAQAVIFSRSGPLPDGGKGVNAVRCASLPGSGFRK